MSDLASFSNRSELVSAVSGKSDRQLLEEAEKAGSEMVLQKIFMGMMMSFDAARANGRSAIIEYDIQGPAAARHRYQVKVDAGQCTIDPGGSARPDVSFRTSVPTFLRLSTNTANPLLLVLFRKLKVQGDVKLAREVKGWFGKRI
jgi:predicted lipid carrier protein YhbT